MTLEQEVNKLRKEMRPVRQRISRLEYALKKQKENNEKFEKKIKELEKEKKEIIKEKEELEKENKELKEEINEIKNQRNTALGMIFKPNIKKQKEIIKEKEKTKRGARYGHKGKSRKNPETIDEEKRVYLTNCPHCLILLNRSNTIYKRMVTDIPVTKPKTTLYHIERQYCGNCKQEVYGIPENTIEGQRLGLNVINLILLHKYKLRTPLLKIKEVFKIQYGISISEGGIQKILHKLKKKFGNKYKDILEEIRKSETRHADETGWRIEGINSWVWLFATKTACFYTIEETRGKGVPERILNNSDGVLVRDDYPAYIKLPLPQQSCFAHLLRKAREAYECPDAPEETKLLYLELKNLFSEIKEITEKPFCKKPREKYHEIYLQKINSIINRNYTSKSAKSIQTRIKNQNKNLLTALIYKDVPLTNNHAERQIRPIVITRKISGGSRSREGAATHAVNMSIVQTLQLEGKHFFLGVKELLTDSNKYLYSLEKGE